MKYSPHMHLILILYVLNFLNVDNIGRTAAERFWDPDFSPLPYARWKEPLTDTWKDPNPVLHRGHDFVCIFPQDEEVP